MIVTHEVTIDLMERKSVPQIEATQFDRYCREIEVKLYTGEVPWVIPQGASVVIQYCCSDGSGGEYDTMPDGSSCFQASENLLTLALVPQVFAVPGTVLLYATVYSQEKAISVFSIGICVHPMIRGDMSDAKPYCNVTGFLPAPASAREGQYLRVAEVDESGRILAVEAADVTGFGGGEPMAEDIPVVFFGESLPQTKTEAIMPFRYVSATMDISGWCSTKAQGNSSMSYPKKNQTVKLYANPECTEKLKVNFKGWGDQNKFCMKANWIDLTHARNVVSARLWADVVKSRENYALLPEEYRSSPNQGAVDGFPVKVYAGGVYQGRYTWNIPKDAWMAGMDKDKEEHCILCGENYDSGCFWTPPKIDGSDWSDEVHDVVPELIHIMWDHAVELVRNSTDEEFMANIEKYFYLDSLIDYHLFGLMSCGLDAYGKNQLYITYNGRKYIAGMYDMDATWGLWWDGAKFVPRDYGRKEYQDYKDGAGNQLYMRLEKCYPEQIQARWGQLRSGALSVENILMRFEQFIDIAPENLVKEDYAVTTADGAYAGIPLKTSNNIQQIRSFVAYRHGWCDDYVSELTPDDVIRCTGISFQFQNLTLTEGNSHTISYTVTPEDCMEPVSWSSSNPGIVSVEEGNITAHSKGVAQITATCGAYSAVMEVEVISDAPTVETVACTGITLDKVFGVSFMSAITSVVGMQQTVTATVTPDNCTEEVIWSSSDTSVATVDGGVVTAAGNGNCTVTATCGQYSASCQVTVNGKETVKCTGISFKHDALTVGVDAVQMLDYTITPDGCTELVVWSCDDNSVAVISNGTITAIAPGTVVITATCGAYSDTIEVEVLDNTLPNPPTVGGDPNNLLSNASWYVGEVSESNGLIVDTATEARYTDTLDISEFAGKMMKIVCAVDNYKYSRIAMYDENMEYLGSIYSNTLGIVSANAKYARISIYGGVGKTLEVYGFRVNQWDVLPVNEGAYPNGNYNPNDTNSCHILLSVEPGQKLAVNGVWGVAFLDGGETGIGFQSLNMGTHAELTVPDNAAVAAVCTTDSNLSMCICNVMSKIGESTVQ